MFSSGVTLRNFLLSKMINAHLSAQARQESERKLLTFRNMVAVQNGKKIKLKLKRKKNSRASRSSPPSLEIPDSVPLSIASTVAPLPASPAIVHELSHDRAFDASLALRSLHTLKAWVRKVQDDPNGANKCMQIRNDLNIFKPVRCRAKFRVRTIEFRVRSIEFRALTFFVKEITSLGEASFIHARSHKDCLAYMEEIVLVFELLPKSLPRDKHLHAVAVSDALARFARSVSKRELLK
jgi:hypothetical protein